MNYFYTNIKHIREQRKLSLQKMAELINVNASTISRWENNNMGVTIDNAFQISNALKIPMADLVGKDLRLEENVILDENHKLDLLIMDKTKELSEEDKKKVADIIDIVISKEKQYEV